MKHSHPSKKLVGAILILALLTCLFAVVLTAASAVVYTAYNLDQRITQMKALCVSVKKEFELYDTVVADVMKRDMIMNSLDFDGQADEIREAADGKPCLTAGGAVIRVEHGKLTLPAYGIAVFTPSTKAVLASSLSRLISSKASEFL